MTPNKKRTLRKEFSSNPKLLYQNFIAEPNHNDTKTTFSDVIKTLTALVIVLGVAFLLFGKAVGWY